MHLSSSSSTKKRGTQKFSRPSAVSSITEPGSQKDMRRDTSEAEEYYSHTGLGLRSAEVYDLNHNYVSLLDEINSDDDYIEHPPPAGIFFNLSDLARASHSPESLTGFTTCEQRACAEPSRAMTQCPIHEVGSAKTSSGVKRVNQGASLNKSDDKVQRGVSESSQDSIVDDFTSCCIDSIDGTAGSDHLKNTTSYDWQNTTGYETAMHRTYATEEASPGWATSFDCFQFSSISSSWESALESCNCCPTRIR